MLLERNSSTYDNVVDIGFQESHRAVKQGDGDVHDDEAVCQ